MLKKRIIPCLDIMDGKVVKGVCFEDIRDAGDPVALAERYVAEGADELVFLDITATIEKRKTLLATVEKIAAKINIPFTVGGGIEKPEDVLQLLRAGADKVSLNSAALKRPQLISEIAGEVGSQCVVVAIDTKFAAGSWKVFSHGGRTATDRLTLDWAIEATALGAGELLLTSMNNDGTQQGFALDITQEVAERVHVPVIASGGAGSVAHFATVFSATGATGALAASVFHFGTIAIPDLKLFLLQQQIPIRL